MKLRLRLAQWLAGSRYLIVDVSPELGSPVPVEPKPLGKVVEADGPDPQWKPEQHGSVIMQEPDLVRVERERDETVQ